MPVYDPTYRSRLEHALDFDHLGFREFMASKSNSPDNLCRFSEIMADSDNPIVQYAAGSAAAELALYRPGPAGMHTLALSDRLDALEMAQTCWTAASRNIDAYRDSQALSIRKDQVVSNGLRIQRNLAYLPLMEVGAAWLAGEPLSADEVKVKREITQKSALEVGRCVASLPPDMSLPRNRGQKLRLIAETLCGLIANADLSGPYVTIPTPLRKHSGSENSWAMGVGYFALCAYPPYRKTSLLIACRPPEQPVTEERALIMVAPRDFARLPKYSLERVLGFFMQRQDGRLSHGPRVVLDELTHNMRKRLDAFNNKINVKSMHQAFSRPAAGGREN